MSAIESTLDTRRRSQVGSLLQDTLNELLELSLQAKQAHWNVVGANFRSLHLQLDEMVDEFRRWSDEVAERKVTLGLPASGQAASVAAGSGLEALPTDYIGQHAVVRAFSDRLLTVIRRNRERIDAVEDVVTRDLLVRLTCGLEQQAWMIQAQQS